MTTRKQVINEARKWLGVPYRHQGRSVRGLDCGGLLIVVSQEIGFAYKERFTRYSRNAETFNLRQEMNRVLEPIDKESIQPGDFLLFRFQGLAHHVAITTDYPGDKIGMIHTHAGVGKVAEHRFANAWKSHLMQAFKIPDIGDW